MGYFPLLHVRLRCEETGLQITFSMGLGYYFRENWSAVWKPEFSFHSQSSMWGEDFSVNSRIVLENCIFWYRIMVLGAYSSAPKLKTTKALPPQALRSKPDTKTTDVTQPDNNFLGGVKPRLPQLPRLKFPINIIPRKKSWTKITLIKLGCCHECLKELLVRESSLIAIEFC